MRSPVQPWVLALALVIVLVVGALIWFTVSLVQDNQARPPAGSSSPSGTPDALASTAQAGGCPEATVTVTNAAELRTALAGTGPGAVIRLADGVYAGNFVGTGNGTPEKPIMLCGTAGSILDGGQLEDGYVFQLNRASHWVLQGFAVRNGQKGVMVDETTNSTLRGLTVSTTGDEAIHLRKFSTDNKVLDNSIRDTGLRKPKFGEGVYIGTAESNWCEISSCEPDKSDRNEVAGNDISGTSAESVDIKEGTSGGILRDNKFDGSKIADADSWVDVKGNGWTIDNNFGRNAPVDGFQTHEILDGWGTGNVFRNNTAEVNGPGFGYSLKPVRDNVVECSNKASQAGKGLSNEPCKTV
ncbi:right-handed parallel beta-helix repeat-containing protein [Pseudarthrobacter sp. MM222]|uniref:right-handed parallel beta-helix repeat-containing protein n=1 Tax=Pseudarthrobacter sp. MM222 TaxID=3018929 RepID=UPI00221F5AB1|nr:right-handed parallel beta-helix repeat-containing protein [Pseudarthrobacter sp. MM222]CAI3803261.1 hypothetical protein NKCBBBOE_03304 [Pseudarthrobacter sp. MM222]